MLSYVMMALGSYRFAVTNGGFDKISRNTAWRWPALERIGQAPALQYVGPGEDKVTINGVIFPHFRGGLGQVAAMRAQAGRGSPLALVTGYGEYWGDFVILSIHETRDVLMADSAPRKIEFEIELQRYA
jgi:phage protein U